MSTNWMEQESLYVDGAVAGRCWVGFVVCPKAELPRYLTMIKNKPYATHVNPEEIREQSSGSFSIAVGFPGNITDDMPDSHRRYFTSPAASL